jgi:hypothetical protein
MVPPFLCRVRAYQELHIEHSVIHALSSSTDEYLRDMDNASVIRTKQF